MKKITLFASVAAVVAISFSCTKEKESVISVDPKENQEEVQSPVGHEAIIGLSLGEDTKTTHSVEVVAGKTNVKTLWKTGDKILVTFTKAAVEHKEVFELSSGENTANGTFRKGDSVLKAGDTYSVTYYSSNDYEKTFSWANQTGSVEDIPEYLTSVADATYPAAPTLQSELVHFHFNLNAGEDPGDEALELANAYFSNTSNAFIVDTENHTGEIKITPASAFSYNDNGESTNADFYVSVKLAGDSNGNTMKLDLMNGDHYAGIQGYSLSWDITKNYTTDKVYKLTSAASGTEKVLAYQSGLVGAANNSIGWWGDFSDSYSIPVGSSLTLDFINYGSQEQTWNNWDLVVTNNVLRGGAGYSEYFVLRADHWAGSLNRNLRLSDDYDWGRYSAVMEGAHVTLVIDHVNDGYVLIKATIVSSDKSTTFHETFYQKVSKTEPIIAFLTTDKSHYIMKGAILSACEKSISSISAAATAYKMGAAEYITVSTESVKVLANFDSGEEILLDRDDYTVTLTGGQTVYPTNVSLVADVFTVDFTNAKSEALSVKGSLTIGNSGHTPAATLGASDNTSAWITWLDANYYIAPGTSETIGLTITNSAASAVYQSPCTVVRKDNVDKTEYAFCRMDNYGWCYAKNTNANLAELGWSLSRGTATDEFIRSKLVGSQVYITVNNCANSEKASIRYYIVFPGDAGTHYQYFDNIAADLTELFFTLAIEHCYLTFK